MSETSLLQTGQELLAEVARRYAGQHGLRPDAVEWDQQYDGWRLRVTTPDHALKVVFSQEEIEDFAAEGPGSKGSKVKIRNAFAHLTM